MRVVYGVLLFLSFLLHVTLYLIFHGPLFFPVSPHANHPHTADQTPVTKAHSTAEHNWAICSAQAALLGIIKSLFAPNYGSLLSAPFTYVFSCLVRRRPRSGALVIRIVVYYWYFPSFFFFFYMYQACMYVYLFDLSRPPVFSPTQITPVLPIRT